MKSADYTVVFNTDGGQKRYSPSDLDEFSQFRVGSTWTLSLNAVGGDPGCEALSRNEAP